jgi:SAM-dependent methyltransferase
LNVDIDLWFFDKQYKKDQQFDIITNFHVIEHLVNPIEFINNIHFKLKKWWLLVIETPNYKSFNSNKMKSDWPFIIPNEHLFYFSFESLSYILEKKWFRILNKQSIWPFIHNKSKKLVDKDIRSNNPSNIIKIIKFFYDIVSEKFGFWDHLLIIAEKK